MANAEEELKNTVGFNWQGYASAANYAVTNKTNYDEALTWIDKAITMNKSFATLNIKANLLRQQGNTAEADKIMGEAVPIATEAELNVYGYQLIALGQIDKAIEILLLNTQKHPESANAWDSLGEAYATKGDKDKAVTSFKKSLGMNPPPLVKANSEKFLKQLGAM
jgi:tetratricopeptide (TPR) repeat protein